MTESNYLCIVKNNYTVFSYLEYLKNNKLV